MGLASACGGSEFVAELDAGELDAGVERADDAGDGSGELDQAETGDEPPACDLKPCACGGVHLALCCNGPCPSGFEGLSCYCGDCRFGQTYDAGRCF